LALRALIPVLALAGLTACEAAPQKGPFAPIYEGIETRLLDGDLVQFAVAMRGARDNGDVEDYAECAAAQYALIRGYGFARHLRTNVYEEGGLWHGDAVYTISAALPAGLVKLDAEVVALACAENGIPMV
jgi:hypothetical protein